MCQNILYLYNVMYLNYAKCIMSHLIMQNVSKFLKIQKMQNFQKNKRKGLKFGKLLNIQNVLYSLLLSLQNSDKIKKNKKM
jgi:hypothetical protein